MSIHDLPPEVWGKVIRMLRNPRPPPLSKPPRSAIRQPDLLALMQTCKLFHALCTPVLYKEVVTDNLPLFLAQIDQPSHLTNLCHTRKLYIEYSDKSHLSVVKPDQGDGAQAAGRNLQQCSEVAAEYEEEVKGLLEVVRLIEERGVDKLFPQINSLAVANLYGADEGSWHCAPREPYNYHFDGIVLDSSASFRGALASSKLKYFCVREGHRASPLRIDHTLRASRSSSSVCHIDRTSHFGMSTQAMSSPSDCPTRWCSDIALNQDWSTKVCWMGDVVYRLRHYRQTIPGELHQDKAEVKLYFPTGSHCSTRHIAHSDCSLNLLDIVLRNVPPGQREEGSTFSVDDQRRIAAELGSSLQQHLRESNGLNDSFEWYASADTPVCGACGSGPPS